MVSHRRPLVNTQVKQIANQLRTPKLTNFSQPIQGRAQASITARSGQEKVLYQMHNGDSTTNRYFLYGLIRLTRAPPLNIIREMAGGALKSSMREVSKDAVDCRTQWQR